MSSQSDTAGNPPPPADYVALGAVSPHGAYTLQVGGPGSSPVPGASVCVGSSLLKPFGPAGSRQRMAQLC